MSVKTILIALKTIWGTQLVAVRACTADMFVSRVLDGLNKDNQVI